MVERQRRSKGEARRQAIVDAAVELIAEDAEPLSHRSAARRAGVPDSAPSYYFESIEELTVEAFRTAIHGFIARIEALTAAVEETPMTPEEVIRAYVDGAPADTRATRLQFAAYLSATRHPALQREVESAIAAMTNAAERVIRALGRPDLVWAAPIIVAFVDGYTLQRVVRPDMDYAGLEDGLLALLRGLESRG